MWIDTVYSYDAWWLTLPCTLYTKQQWQQDYQLYTKQQQLYFFAYIVSVVAEIKYIDIEFENQPVALPLFGNDFASTDIIGERINAGDVLCERGVAENFENLLIPPRNVSHISKGKNSKTKALKMVNAPINGLISPLLAEKTKCLKQQQIYVQDDQLSVHLHSISDDQIIL